MATTDQVILEFLIKEMGSADAIKSLKGIEKQSKEIIKLAEAISSKYGTSMTRAISLLQQFSDKENEISKKGIGPGGFNQQALDLAKVQAIRSDALEKEKAITKEKEKQAKEQAKLDSGRIKDVERAQQLAMIENQIFDARKALSRPDVAAQLSGLGGKTPYQQTQSLIPLMTKLSKETGASSDAMLKLVKSMYGIDDTVIRNTTRGIHDMKNGIGDTAKEMFNLKTIMNTAFGVGMAMIIFQLQMLISKFFTDTIQQVKDLQIAISKLSIVEQLMSQAGVEVSGKDLLDIISKLKKDFTNISETDLLAATGDMGTRLAEKGITPQELEQLMRVSLGKQIVMPGRELTDIQNLITNYALTGEKQSVSSLGINFTEEMVKKEAVRLGLLKDISDELTVQSGLHARISLMYQSYEKSSDKIIEQQENLSNAGNKLSAAWKDLTVQFSDVVNLWNALIYIIAIAIQGWVQLFEILRGTRDAVTPIEKALKWIFDISSTVRNLIPVVALWNSLMWSIAAAYEAISGRKMSEQPSVSTLAKQDTPTMPSSGMAEDSENNSERIQKSLNDLFEAMDSFGDRARNAEEDFQNESSKRWDDYYNDVYGDRTRFLEDWEIDRQKIISDSEDAIEDKKRERDKKKRNDEAKFLEELRQLREKYLMNLDDALHERDARQVLKLAREYAMNKQNLINEYNLRQQQDDQDAQDEISDLIKKRDQRLALLDSERALKLKRMDEDFKLAQARAVLEHQLEMKRLEHEKQDKLRQLANSMAEQLKLGKSGADAIYRMYGEYFGPKGALGDLMKYTYDSSVQYMKALSVQLAALVRGASVKISASGQIIISGHSAGGINPDLIPPRKNHRANGALDIAYRPTTLLFGEKSPEAALTVPLNKLSSFGGFGGSPSGKGASDKMEISLLLSPDLEARVVGRAVGEVENAIVSVRRSL